MSWYKRAANARVGRCYELSGRYVSEHPAAILVHGHIKNPFNRGVLLEVDHAWVEEGDDVYDPVMDKRWPKIVYDRLFDVQVYKKYTAPEVWKMSLQHGHWGTWHDLPQKPTKKR